MFQFGGRKNLSKKKKKDAEEVLTISEDSAIINAANNLIYAEEIARVTGNIEALLAISDRWLIVSQHLALEQLPPQQRIGFLISSEEDTLNVGEDSNQGLNESESRTKIRKKLRKLRKHPR